MSLSETVYSIIEDICREKKEKHILPPYALYSEVSTRLHKQVGEVINGLIKEGKLTWNKTLNDKAFQTTNNEQ